MACKGDDEDGVPVGCCALMAIPGAAREFEVVKIDGGNRGVVSRRYRAPADSARGGRGDGRDEVLLGVEPEVGDGGPVV